MSNIRDFIRPITVQSIAKFNLELTFDVVEKKDDDERGVLFGEDRQEAYRRLFEAAPEMLGLLTTIRDYVSEGWDRENAVSVTDINALIAKIEGDAV